MDSHRLLSIRCLSVLGPQTNAAREYLGIRKWQEVSDGTLPLQTLGDFAVLRTAVGVLDHSFPQNPMHVSRKGWKPGLPSMHRICHRELEILCRTQEVSD
jgi:hypothetical protein